MSIEVPTAEGTPSEEHRSDRPLPRWLLVVLAVLLGGSLIGTVLNTDEEQLDEPVPIDQALEPNLPIDQWDASIFPGSGVFVDIEIGTDGATVALVEQGTNRMTSNRGAVWVRGAPAAAWRWVEVDTLGDWTMASATIRKNIVLVGGALDVGGIPAPALWAGAVGQPLALAETPVEEPGRIDFVENLSDIAVVGVRLTTELRDPLDGTLAGHSRLFAGAPGDWTDVTPPGDQVLVTAIAERGAEWIAVGADNGMPTAWTSANRGENWTRAVIPVSEAATLSSVTVLEDEVYAIARFTDAPPITTQLLRAGVRWTAVGEPTTRNVSWIAAVNGELIGGMEIPALDGPQLPFLWRLDEDGRWTIIEPVRPGPEDQWPILFAAATEDILAGSAVGQPVMWQAPDARSVIEVPTAVDPSWERIGPLPADSFMMTSIGSALYAVSFTPDSSGPAAFTSRNGVIWDPLDLPDGMVVAHLHAAGDQIAMAGYTDRSLLIAVREDDGFRVVAELGGRLHFMTGDGTTIDAYVALAETFRQVRISTDTGEIVETTLPWTPLFMESLGNDVIVAGTSESGTWPPTQLQVSTDGGVDWETHRIQFQSWYRLGDDLIVQGDEGTWLVQVEEAVTVEPVTLPDPLAPPPGQFGMRGAFTWDDGLALYSGGDQLTLLSGIDAEPVLVDVSPSSGFLGAFGYPVDDEFVVGFERGQRILYRLTGGR